MTHDTLLIFATSILYLNEFWCLFRSTIRDKIIPNVISWYTGEASDGESGDLDVDDDDEEEEEKEEAEVEKEEEDDNNGLDDDEDDNEDVDHPKKKV